MRFRPFIQSAHRWLGLALVGQIVIWMSSGVVMSLLPIGHVRGEHLISFNEPPPLKVQNYFPPAGVLADVEGGREVTLKSWLGREVYVVTGSAGKTMFDADTGEKLSPISEQDARRAAQADFAGEDSINRAILMSNPPRETGRKTPLWRVEFRDRDETRLYISPETGEVVARRNRIWRFYDFFWMLHIMDYKERDNFNNPLIRTFAITGLLFALSGLALVAFRIEGGRYAEDFRRTLTKRNGENKKAAD